jgi:hypothetical protein
MADILTGNNYVSEVLTSSATPQPLSPTVYNVFRDGGTINPRFARITVETNPIRYTRSTPVVNPNDGTSFGTVLVPGGEVILFGGGQIANFRFIQKTGAGAVNVEYFQ